MSERDRWGQPERWFADGLEELGKGIAWCGFWIGAGIAVAAIVGAYHG